MDINYRAPARLDDQLLATAEPIAFSRVWMNFRQQVLRASDRTLLCEAEVRVACISLDTGKPRRLPEDMQNLLKNAI